MDLGKLNKRHMKFVCAMKGCTWTPPDTGLSKAAIIHFRDTHGTDQMKMLMLPVCQCGAMMEYRYSRPTGGARSKDYFECPVCNNVGHFIVEMGETPVWREAAA